MSGQLYVQLQGETIKMLALDMMLLSIGRTPDNGLALSHPTVAIRHAEVRRVAEQFVLTDLGAGVTFLAGKRLTPHQPQVLEEGAVIHIGPYVITYALAPSLPIEDAPKPLPLEVLDDVRYTPARSPRVKYPPLPVRGHRSTYLNYLPSVFTESDFVGRFLQVFEAIWEPLQQRQDAVDLYFNPLTCPEPMLNWLAEWFGLPIDPHWPEARRREWLQQAVNLYRWRGTRYGLTRMLEVCCGVTPRIIEDPERPYHLLFLLPAPPESPGEDAEETSRDNLERVIAQHVPAHVVYEVRYV